jgi:hypothetical protein
LLEAFAYMWHAELLDGFEDHFGDVSTFSHTPSLENTWTARITLFHWGISPFEERNVPGKEEKHLANSVFPSEKTFIKPRERRRPLSRHIARLDGGDRETESPKQVHYISKKPESTTIVMTTNALGDFVKCSIVSRIVPEHSLHLFSRDASEVWSMFVNQPQTARCLLFLLLLGVVCEAIAAKFDTIVDVMEDKIGPNRGMIDDEFSWTRKPEAVERLKQFLWELRALQLFNDTLSESIDRIDDARSRLVTQIVQGPGRRHAILEEKAEGYVDDFDQQLGRLVALRNKLQQRIDNLTRFRDGISSVTGLEDSRNSYLQNNHLEILTWITIGYLPLSFVAALFAVPNTQNVVADALGLRWFLVLIFCFFLGTILLANVLGLFWRSFRKALSSRL